MILINVNRYPNEYLSKQYITHESAFFLLQIYDTGLKRFISGSPKFLWSCCSQAEWGILHREKKSCTSIGSCQRILYSKILHCRLRGISMPLLTHVNVILLAFLDLFGFSGIISIFWVLAAWFYVWPQISTGPNVHIYHSSAQFVRVY